MRSPAGRRIEAKRRLFFDHEEMAMRVCFSREASRLERYYRMRGTRERSEWGEIASPFPHEEL